MNTQTEAWTGGIVFVLGSQTKWRNKAVVTDETVCVSLPNSIPTSQGDVSSHTCLRCHFLPQSTLWNEHRVWNANCYFVHVTAILREFSDGGVSTQAQKIIKASDQIKESKHTQRNPHTHLHLTDLR